MKYTILINQAGVVDANLHTKTDVVDWALLDYIFAWQLSPSAKRLDDKFWINYAHLIKEMPLLGLNEKSGVSKRIKKIRDLGLIETVQSQDDQRLYIKTTVKYYEITQFKGSATVDDNQRGVDDNQRGVDDNQHSIDLQYQSIKNNKPKERDAPTKTEKVVIEEPVKVVKEKATKFVEPTIDEIIAYCLEMSFLVQSGEAFFDYYESIGWLVGGKTKMKSWKAALSGWIRRDSNYSKPNKAVKVPTKFQPLEGCYDNSDAIDSTAVNQFFAIGA